MTITAAQIKAARKDLDENQEQFGKRFGVSQPTIHLWEKNGPPPPGAARILLESFFKAYRAKKRRKKQPGDSRVSS